MPISKFTSKILSKKYLTSDVLHFSMSCPEDFDFKAGQFIMIDIERDGAKKAKAYSVLSPPKQKECLELCAKLIPGGMASEEFREMEVGAKYQVKGPFGHFVFDVDADSLEHWFLCAGTGMVPFYCMIKEHVENMPDKKFVLLFSVRTKEDLFLHEELQALADRHSNFEFKPTLTREDWSGLQGRCQVHLPQDLSGKTFYICGLKELVEDVKRCLLEKGVEKDRVKFERYS